MNITVTNGLLTGQTFAPTKWSRDKSFAFVIDPFTGREHRIHHTHFKVAPNMNVDDNVFGFGFYSPKRGMVDAMRWSSMTSTGHTLSGHCARCHLVLTGKELGLSRSIELEAFSKRLQYARASLNDDEAYYVGPVGCRQDAKKVCMSDKKETVAPKFTNEMHLYWSPRCNEEGDKGVTYKSIGSFEVTGHLVLTRRENESVIDMDKRAQSTMNDPGTYWVTEVDTFVRNNNNVHSKAVTNYLKYKESAPVSAVNQEDNASSERHHQLIEREKEISKVEATPTPVIKQYNECKLKETCMVKATPSVKKHRDDLAAHAERSMVDLRLDTESLMYAEQRRLIAKAQRERERRMELVRQECEAIGETISGIGPSSVERWRSYTQYALIAILLVLSHVAVALWTQLLM